jgi:hypothetical protein
MHQKLGLKREKGVEVKKKFFFVLCTAEKSHSFFLPGKQGSTRILKRMHLQKAKTHFCNHEDENKKEEGSS